MKTKAWLIGWFAIVIVALITLGTLVYRIDPYFHYHKPHTESYYYYLNNERSQNDGISTYFDYDALMTGTSMTQNFKTSELNEMFGVNAIKVPFSGGTYKEINDNLKKALKTHPDVKLVVRGLDTSMFLDAPDRMRDELGEYPKYLYDNNVFNDVKYIFNKDVIFSRAYAMTQANNAENFQPGITSFDNYARWQDRFTFGIHTVMPYGVAFAGAGEPVHLTDNDKAVIQENIRQNVTDLVDAYPNTDFYYFFTPYSVLWYKALVEDGTIYQHIEAEKYIIELLLEHENLRLFFFNGNADIVTDINNYKDVSHYGTWVNSYILRCMHENEHRVTKDNYEAYVDQELDLLLNFDYLSLNDQVDYAQDYYSEALLNQKIWGVEPIDVLKSCKDQMVLSHAEVVDDQYMQTSGIRCVGMIDRPKDSEVTLETYMQTEDYVGAKITIPAIGKHNYLVFEGRKVADHGQPTVIAYDSNGNKIGQVVEGYENLDNEWHQYLINLSGVEGDVTIYFNGGYIYNHGSPQSEYIFSNIMLY